MALGFPVFAVGAALVLIHSIWRDPLSIIVSVIGYAALVEGALLLAVPGLLIKIGRWSLNFTRAWDMDSFGLDRKSVGEGKSELVAVDLGGRRLIKNKKA